MRDKRYITKGYGATPDSIKVCDYDGMWIMKWFTAVDARPFCFNCADGTVHIGAYGEAHYQVLKHWMEEETGTPATYGMEYLDFCNELGIVSDNLTNGRFWDEDKVMTVWGIDDTPEWRNHMNKIAKVINEEIDDDIYEYRIVVALDGDDFLLCSLKEFIHPSAGSAASDETITDKRNKYDWISAEYEGKRKYDDYMKNSPYADKRYAFALRENKNKMKRKVIKESQLRAIVNESVKNVLNEISKRTIANAVHKMHSKGQKQRAQRLQKSYDDVYGVTTRQGNKVYWDAPTENLVVSLTDGRAYFYFLDGNRIRISDGVGKLYVTPRYEDRQVVKKLISSLRAYFPYAENLEYFDEDRLIA